jgi:predicted PurR-regulated permease PerM
VNDSGEKTLFSTRRRRVLYISLVSIALLVLSYRLRRVLNPLLLSLLLAYVLDPAVRFAQRRLRLPRAVGTVVIFLVIAGGFGGVVAYSLGTSARGVDELLHRAAGGWMLEPPQGEASIAAPGGGASSAPPSIAGRVFGRSLLIDEGPGLLALDVNGNGIWDPGSEPLLRRTEDGELLLTSDAQQSGWREVAGYLDQIRDALISRYRTLDRDLVNSVVERVKQNTAWLQDAAEALWGWVTHELFGGLMTMFSYVVLVPIYTFFLLAGMPKLRGHARDLLPGRYRGRVLDIAGQIDFACASFFRGRLLLAFGKGVFVWLGLWLCGVEFSVTIGFLVGVFSIIPFLGPALGMLLAVVFSYGPVGWGARLVGAAVVFILSEVLEAVANPMVLGRGVGLHPLTVLVALFAFGELFGVFGVLLAIPLAATAKILGRELLLPELRALAAEGSHAEAAAGGAPGV